MAKVLNFEDFSEIFNTLQHNGRIQVQKLNSQGWIDVTNVDWTIGAPAILIRNGTHVEALSISQIQAVQTVA